MANQKSRWRRSSSLQSFYNYHITYDNIYRVKMKGKCLRALLYPRSFLFEMFYRLALLMRHQLTPRYIIQLTLTVLRFFYFVQNCIPALWARAWGILLIFIGSSESWSSGRCRLQRRLGPSFWTPPERWILILKLLAARINILHQEIFFDFF